jgi:hypothetical protein
VRRAVAGSKRRIYLPRQSPPLSCCCRILLCIAVAIPARIDAGCLDRICNLRVATLMFLEYLLRL